MTTTAPDLRVRFKRHPDGSSSLTCVRPDGTTTWQRQQGPLGQVFPPHDLTHFAVETTLGYRHGFYGLIADGWDMADFAKPWPRGPIPDEAQEVELVVGFLDAERMSGGTMDDAAFNEHAATYVDARNATRPGAAVLPRALTGEELRELRACRASLFARWFALQPGDTLELEFRRASS